MPECVGVGGARDSMDLKRSQQIFPALRLLGYGGLPYYSTNFIQPLPKLDREEYTYVLGAADLGSSKCICGQI